MKTKNLNEMTEKIFKVLVERFGTPIGKSPSTVGVPDERANEAKVCEKCGEEDCGCRMNETRRGPSKKTAKKILKGTKTFKEKEKKVAGWADDPAAAAAWMQHKATGKWPRED